MKEIVPFGTVGHDRFRSHSRMRPAVLMATCILAALASPFVGAAPIDTVAWLAGCWSGEHGDAGTGEYWLPPAGGRMLGIGRIVREGKPVEHEFLELDETDDGRLVYTATPSGQTRTSFMSTQVSESSVTFENPAHDFPQRITYIRSPGNSLLVRIEGVRKGQLRQAEFRFVKSDCADRPASNLDAR